jgi:hypothetical protein
MEIAWTIHMPTYYGIYIYIYIFWKATTTNIATERDVEVMYDEVNVPVYGIFLEVMGSTYIYINTQIK